MSISAKICCCRCNASRLHGRDAPTIIPLAQRALTCGQRTSQSWAGCMSIREDMLGGSYSLRLGYSKWNTSDLMFTQSSIPAFLSKMASMGRACCTAGKNALRLLGQDTNPMKKSRHSNAFALAYERIYGILICVFFNKCRRKEELGRR